MNNILFEDEQWKILKEDASLPDGRRTTWVRIHRCEAVNVLPFKDPETILLLREYRPFWAEWCWMIPSGKVDKETDLIEAAQRELREESGYRAEKLEPWFTTTHSESLAYSNHVFIARDLKRDPLDQDHDELIEVHEVPIRQAIEDVSKNHYKHTMTAYTLLRYGMEHGICP